jgi:uncharacterized protein
MLALRAMGVLSTMHQHLATEEIPYTGRELRSHWIMQTFALTGDAVVAFIGPCEVALDAMVDLADVAAGEFIRARRMLHIIVERFDTDLEKGVLWQRLLVALAGELLCEQLEAREERDGVRDCLELTAPLSPEDTAATALAPGEGRLRRSGDDLFVGDHKLSVSIATVSPVSTLIHLGINIDPAGAPVAAVGLDDLGIEPTRFAKDLLLGFVSETGSVQNARCKVRPVS